MMFRILILLFCFSTFCKAQNHELDSIKQQTYALKQDSNKVIALHDLCKKYFSIDNDSALSIAITALKISTEIEFERGIAQSLFYIGNTYYHFKNFTKAEYYYNESLAKAIALNFDLLTAFNYRHLGNLQHEQGFFDKGVSLLRKGLKIHLAMKDTLSIAHCYLRISVFFRESMDIDSAHFYSEKTIALSFYLNDQGYIARAYRNLAIIYLVSKDYTNSELYFIKAIKFQEQYGSKREVAFTYSKYGLLLLQQKKYNKAIYYLKKSIKTTVQIKLLKNLPVLYENLELAQKGLGQYKNAYNTFLLFVAIEDSLRYEKEHKAQIAIDAEVKAIDLQNETLLIEQAKNDKKAIIFQRTVLALFLILALIILLLLSKNAQKKELLKKSIAEHEKQHLKQETKKTISKQRTATTIKIAKDHEYIKERIAKELHDGLGGTLASIRLNLSQLQDTNDYPYLKAIIKQLDMISNDIRILSHSMTPPALRGQTFSNLIQDYLVHQFEQSNIHLIIDLLPKSEINKLPDNIQLTLYRALQDICDDIIKYSEATEVSFHLIVHDDYVSLLAEDNGVGIDNPKTFSENHWMSLIKQRLLLLDGEIHLDSKAKQGTTFDVSIPLQTDEKA